MAFLWFISTVNRGKCQPGKGRRSKGILQVLEVEPGVHFPSYLAQFPLSPWLCCLLHQEGCPPISEMLQEQKGSWRLEP